LCSASEILAVAARTENAPSTALGAPRGLVPLCLQMGRNFLITATGAGAGKSTVACALGFAFRARGMRVGVMKPAATGCDRVGAALDPADIRGVALAAGCTLPLDLICPYRYRSPLAPAAAADADGAAPPDLTRIEQCYRRIAEASDVVLVEGAAGIADPITWESDSADLAAMLALDAIVVVADRPGCLNAGLLTIRYARSRGLAVAGWLLNDAEPGGIDSQAISGALARLTDAPLLGAMRHKEPLGLAIVEKLLAWRG
jgi:dethiobiotin synthetase